MESIFKTTSQFDVPTPTSVDPLPITTPTTTSSTIATTTTTTTTIQAPILPTTVPSTIIQNLPSFGSLFRFDDRLRSLEENFFEFKKTNQFTGAVSAIPGIIHQYMDQQMNEKIIKEQVKEQVKAQVSKILPRIEQAMNEQLEAETRLGSKRRREGKEPESASAPMKTATRSADRSTQGFRSRQASASESALAEEPMQTTSQMEEPSHPEYDTGADDQPIVQSSQHPE
nr:hypothetical protein [Tanacetum cinerariifolium]